MAGATTPIPQLPRRLYLSLYHSLGSVRLAVFLLSVTALTVLIGSWCPQAPQVGRQKVIEQFGATAADWLTRFGIVDIFHTPFFLVLISILATSLLAASLQRVFPRALVKWRQNLTVISSASITRQPCYRCKFVESTWTEALHRLSSELRRANYAVTLRNNALAAERGKLGVLAAAVTHVGLITLLAGVTVTAWTGFAGFEAVARGDFLSFASSQHSKLWLGKLPPWRARVDDTYRVNYANGDPRQWYSRLSVVDGNNHVLKRQLISVNNPLSYEGVDIYQSNWAFDHIRVSFNGSQRVMELRPMGRVMAAFMPLDAGTILIFSTKDISSPIRIFAKTEQWNSPRLITSIAPGMTAKLGSISLRYDGPVPTTGLQYKSDPGFPLTLAGFVLVMTGITLAAMPYRRIWAEVVPPANDQRAAHEHTMRAGGCEIKIGGTASKGRRAFEGDLDRLLRGIT